MLGGKGRGHAFDAPVDYDQLLVNVKTQRQMGPSAIRIADASLSRFVEAPSERSPVKLGFPQTIPVGGPNAPSESTVPAIDSPQVTIGR